MKIFTATFYRNNYGSALQAYALQQKLIELGGDPVIIAAASKNTSKQPRLLGRFLNIFRSERHYGPIRRIRRDLEKRIYTAKTKKINQFISDNMRIEALDNCLKDIKKENSVLLAGSDQIWSIIDHPIREAYLFSDVNFTGIRKVSYAASIGISELTDEQRAYYKSVLASFDSVSFREKVAYDLLKADLTNPVVRNDIDPTLLYPGEFWERFVADRPHNKPYLFVYMLRPSSEIIRIARRLAKKWDLDIVYMGLYVNYYPGIKTVSDAGVEDFLTYIKHAEIVITNSFHGTVFSLLFEKRFASVQISSTSSRAENLLEMAGLTDHLISDISGAEIAEQEYDFGRVKSRLAKKREQSIGYLREIVES